MNVLWITIGFPTGLSVFFFLSVLCVFLCVWLWWIKTRLSFAVYYEKIQEVVFENECIMRCSSAE